MFVFKNKLNGKYVKRITPCDTGANEDTYRALVELDDATLFNGWGEVAEWLARRRMKGYESLPETWQLVEVEVVYQPQVKVVKVIG